jgi:hypothetical protein
MIDLRLQLLAGLLGLALGASAHAAEREFVSTQGNTPRLIRIWIPNELPHVRGLFVVWKRGAESWDVGGGVTSTSVAPAGFGNNPTTGTTVLYYHPAWREFMTGMGLGMMLVLGGDGSDLDASTGRDGDPYGGGDFIHDVLATLGQDASLARPELASAPLLLHGHSRTCKMVSSYASLWPHRSLGFIQYHGENNITGTGVDPSLTAAGQVPSLLLAGELDNNPAPVQYDPHNLAMLAAGRAVGARWATGMQWGMPHGGGGSGAPHFQRNTIIFPWIAATLNQRLPAIWTPGKTPQLRLPAEEYLGDHLSDFVHGTSTAFPSPETKSWLPGPAFGAIWKTYFDRVATSSANTDAAAQTLVTVSPLRPVLSADDHRAQVTFGVVRTGAATSSLTVNLVWGGSAEPGVDYNTPPTQVTFAAGQRSALIELTPLLTATSGREKTITLAAAVAPAYERVTPAEATVTLSGSAPPTLTEIEMWRQTFFGSPENQGVGANSADPDQDGVTNLVEFALGSAPNAAVSTPTISYTLHSGPGMRLALTFTPQAVTAIDYGVEASSDLANWTYQPIAPAALTIGQTFTFVDTVELLASSPPTRFLRLAVRTN